jgi:hypothetical protein
VPETAYAPWQHELRVNSRAEILPTYRLVTPPVCAVCFAFTETEERVLRRGVLALAGETSPDFR